MTSPADPLDLLVGGGGEIERVYHKSHSFDETRDWDIHQQVSMTHEERQEVASVLKKRVYGENVPDVREYHRGK